MKLWGASVINSPMFHPSLRLGEMCWPQTGTTKVWLSIEVGNWNICAFGPINSWLHFSFELLWEGGRGQLTINYTGPKGL